MHKKTLIIISIALVSLTLISPSNDRLAYLCTLFAIFPAVYCLFEKFQDEDISVRYTNKELSSQFIIKNDTKSEINKSSLVMVTPNFRFKVNIPWQIERGGSLILETSKNSGIHEITYSNERFGFQDRKIELYEDIISTWGTNKVYFELYTDNGLYIPQYTTHTLSTRAVLYFRAKYPKYFKTNRINVVPT